MYAVCFRLFCGQISSVVFANMFLSPSIHVNFGMEAWLKRLVGVMDGKNGQQVAARVSWPFRLLYTRFSSYSSSFFSFSPTGVCLLSTFLLRIFMSLF